MCPRPPAVGARWEAVADPGGRSSPPSQLHQGAASGDTEVRSPDRPPGLLHILHPSENPVRHPRVPIFSVQTTVPSGRTKRRWLLLLLDSRINPVWVWGSFKTVRS